MESTHDDYLRDLSLVEIRYRVHEISRIRGAVVNADTLINLSEKRILETACLSDVEFDSSSRVMQHAVF